MTTSKHTPGPWEYRGLTMISSKARGILANICVSPEYFTQQEIRANGLLIAAAPRMLAVLETILSSSRSDGALTIGHSVLCKHHDAMLEDTITAAGGYVFGAEKQTPATDDPAPAEDAATTAACHALDSLIKLTGAIRSSPRANEIVGLHTLAEADARIVELRAIIKNARGPQ